MKLSWSSKAFGDLNTEELFELLKLRQSVFVVEQECAYPDIDHIDRIAMHLCGWHDTELVAYARLVKPKATYSQASIGRVVVAPNARGQRLGRILMEEALRQTDRIFPNQPVKIGAQERLEKFYTGLGFIRTSEMYMEDGIPHIHMVRG